MEKPTHKTRANLIVDGQSNNSEANSSINSSDVSIDTGLHNSLSSSTAASLSKRWPPSLEAEQDLTAVGASIPTIYQASDEDDAKLETIFEPTIQAKCINIQQESNAEQKPPEQPFGGRGRNKYSSSRGKGNDRSDIIQSTSTGTLIFGHGASELSEVGASASHREKDSSSSSATNVVATMLPQTKLEYSVKKAAHADINIKVDSDVGLPRGINVEQESNMKDDSIPTNKTAGSYERRATPTQVLENEEVIQPPSSTSTAELRHSPMKLRARKSKEEHSNGSRRLRKELKKKMEADSIPTNKTAESSEHRATSTRVINEEVFEDEEYIEEDIGVIQPQSGMIRLNPQYSPMKLRVKEIRELDEEKSILSRRRGRHTCPRCSKYLKKGHVCVLNNIVKYKVKTQRKIPEVDGVATDE